MLEACAGDLDERLWASVHENQQVVKLLLPDEVAFLLRDEDALTQLKELLRVGQFFIHYTLTEPVKNNSDEPTNCDDDGGVEPNDGELQGVTEERADNLLVVDKDDQVLLLLHLLLLHLSLVLLPQFLVDLTRALFPLFGSVLRFDVVLGVSAVENTWRITKVCGTILTASTIRGTKRECPVVDHGALPIEL